MIPKMVCLQMERPGHSPERKPVFGVSHRGRGSSRRRPRCAHDRVRPAVLATVGSFPKRGSGQNTAWQFVLRFPTTPAACLDRCNLMRWNNE